MLSHGFGQIVTEPTINVLALNTSNWSVWDGLKVFVSLDQESFWMEGFGKIEKDGHLRTMMAKQSSLEGNRIILLTVDLSESQVYARLDPKDRTAPE